MILGQVAPGAGVLTPLYVVPRGYNYAKIQEFLACNRDAAASTFRLAIGTGPGAIQEWIYFDLPISAFDSFYLNGAALEVQPPNGFYVQSGNGSMSFSLFGILV